MESGGLTTILMETEPMQPEELILILRYLEKQGFRPRVLTEDPLVLALDLPELEPEGAIYSQPSGNSGKKTA
jgi:hypothetical protein